jgi:hypothetical protein
MLNLMIAQGFASTKISVILASWAVSDVAPTLPTGHKASIPQNHVDLNGGTSCRREGEGITLSYAHRERALPTSASSSNSSICASSPSPPSLQLEIVLARQFIRPIHVLMLLSLRAQYPNTETYVPPRPFTDLAIRSKHIPLHLHRALKSQSALLFKSFPINACIEILAHDQNHDKYL